MKIKPLANKVLVSDIESGERQIGKTILPDDNGKVTGVRSRWAQIYAVGDDVVGLKAGDWVLVKHGRWTRSHKVEVPDGEDFMLWGIEYPDGLLMISETKPNLDTFGDYTSVSSLDTGIPSMDYKPGLSEY